MNTNNNNIEIAVINFKKRTAYAFEDDYSEADVEDMISYLSDKTVVHNSRMSRRDHPSQRPIVK